MSCMNFVIDLVKFFILFSEAVVVDTLGFVLTFHLAGKVLIDSSSTELVSETSKSL